MLSNLLLAIALVMVFEGVLWALFPSAMKKAVISICAMEDEHIRFLSTAIVAVGVCLVWFVKS